MSKAHMLRRRLSRGELLLSAGAWDVMSAKLVMEAGFDLVAVQSAQVTFARGVTDTGIVGPREVAQLASDIIDQVELPVIVDAEEGWGDPGNMYFWAKTLHRMGVSAIHLDDFPSVHKCPHVQESFTHTGELGDPEFLCQVIRAAKDAAGEELLICVKTGANYAPFPLEEGIRRAALYREAGAEVLFPPYSVRGIQKFREALAPPFFIQPSFYLTRLNAEADYEFGTMNWDDLHKLVGGGLIVNNPAVALHCAVYTMKEVLRLLREEKTGKVAEKFGMVIGEEWQRLWGYPEAIAARKRSAG